MFKDITELENEVLKEQDDEKQDISISLVIFLLFIIYLYF